MKALHILISLFLPSFFLSSCFVSLVLSFSSSQTDPQNQCLDDQRSTLLQLQHDLYYAPNFTFSSKFELWDLNTNCCSWEGVTCDALGHVIGLDLSFKNLSGSFHFVFNLHHLQHLNLAGNNFNSTLLSYEFDKLPNLTHLNLSSSCFHGQIPVEISYLTRLVSLDLSNQDGCYWSNGQIFYSYDYDDLPTLKLEEPDFETLIKNLRSLKELFLDGVKISTQSNKWCEIISSTLLNLHSLSMSSCGLTGPFCSSMLSRLHFLSKLNLNNNPIFYLPSNFSTISSPLVSLSLIGCELIGHFPPEVFLLPKIQSIDISGNSNLVGELPEFSINNSLRLLSLFDTEFSGKLPKSIGNLKFLTELDLGYCHFIGSIPSSIANLTRLEYVSLGGNRLSGPIRSFIFTLPALHTLYLGGNQLAGEIDEFPNASCSLLQYLDLSSNYLRGLIPKSILQLPELESLYIGSNNFGSMKFDMFSQLKKLKTLDLSNTSLSSKSDNKSISFPQLEDLSLRFCNLTEFPEFIKTQNKLADLDLSYNQIHSVVPNWLWKNTLSSLDLSFNAIDFPKPLPFGDTNSSFPVLSFSNESSNKSLTLPQLYSLRLNSCNLTEFPEFIKTLDKLASLDLSNNKIHGFVPNWLWKSTLLFLDLSSNLIDFPKQLPLRHADSSFPMLRELFLQSCNISTFPEFLRSQEKLEYLGLSNNKISGAIPNWVWKKSLRSLYLSNNSLSSLDQFLPNQNLTSSQGSLSRSICNLNQLSDFDASYNKFYGPIPSCLGQISTLQYLDLQENNFSGNIPDFAKATQLFMLQLGVNKLEGKLPRSLANCTMLRVLDVGNNTIYDTFPSWLGKLPALMVLILRGNRFYGPIKHLKNDFSMLDVLDIASNNFSGQLSTNFFPASQLRSLKLGENKLEGELPRSLANCKKLEVLDLGKNMIHDTFPFWSVKLPSLKVLILRANRFYGTIKLPKAENAFPMLRILDLAYNNFSGGLSVEFLQSLEAMMMMIEGNKATPNYIGDVYYQDSLTIVNKGFEMFYQKILTIFVCLDLSNNHFRGMIPEEIQNLKSLKMLNLSYNSFIGPIPLSLGNLTQLESLDLSNNELSGKIPQQLASLTFLAVLNLSCNQLEGSIPQSSQFGTFSNDSYSGNPRLCGPPFTRKCNEADPGMPPEKAKEKEDADSLLDGLTDWKIMLIGYGGGLVIGLCIGYTVLNELGNKCLNSLTRNKNRRRRRSR